MKVKCINKKVYNKGTKEYDRESYALTLGKEYILLSVEVHFDESLYMLVDDENFTPAYYQAQQFEITSHKIPSNWKVCPGRLTSTLFTIGPEAWSGSFLEDYHNAEPYALEIYKREVKIIFEEEK